MKTNLLLLAVLFVAACASHQTPAEDIVTQSGCFEFPLGESPDGGKSMACTVTGADDAQADMDESETPDD